MSQTLLKKCMLMHSNGHELSQLNEHMLFLFVSYRIHNYSVRISLNT